MMIFIPVTAMAKNRVGVAMESGKVKIDVMYVMVAIAGIVYALLVYYSPVIFQQ